MTTPELQDELDDTPSTAYDSAGRVASVNDSKGVTTYGYDGTDAAGKSEHRGLVTSLKVTRGGSAGTRRSPRPTTPRPR